MCSSGLRNALTQCKIQPQPLRLFGQWRRDRRCTASEKLIFLKLQLMETDCKLWTTRIAAVWAAPGAKELN